MSKKNSVARQAGHLFAYLQHATDKTIEWGFRSMRKAAQSPARSVVKKKGVLGKVGRAGRGILSFVGNAGEAYYERYEELKKSKDVSTGE